MSLKWTQNVGLPANVLPKVCSFETPLMVLCQSQRFRFDYLPITSFTARIFSCHSISVGQLIFRCPYFPCVSLKNKTYNVFKRSLPPTPILSEMWYEVQEKIGVNLQGNNRVPRALRYPESRQMCLYSWNWIK